MNTSTENIFGEEAIDETSFIASKGKEPLLGKDWAQKIVPTPAPRNKKVQRHGSITPLSSPVHSPSHEISPRLQQVFSPVKSFTSSPVENINLPIRSRILSPVRRPVRRQSPVNSPVTTPKQKSFSPVTSPIHDGPSTSKHNINLPVNPSPDTSPVKSHVFAEVYISPNESPKNKKDTVIEMSEALSPIKTEKRSSKKSTSNKLKPSPQISFDVNVTPQDFFLRCEDHSISRNTAASPLNVSPSRTADSPAAEHARFTLEEYFGVDLPQLTEYHDPEYVPNVAKPGVIFYPSAKSVNLDEKLGEDFTPRFLEEEGIYVGNKPEMTYNMRNKIEQRLIQKPASNWFGEDGEIISVEDAVRKVPLIPNISEEVPPCLSTYFKQAEEFRDVTLIDPILIELELRSLTFTHHELQNTEQTQAHHVTELFRQYEKRKGEARAERLLARLKSLRQARNLLMDQDARLQRVHEDIREIRNAAFREGAHDRSLLAALLSAWSRLRDIRETQGFVSSPVRLRLAKRPEKKGVENADANWNRENEEVVREMLLEQEWSGDIRSEKEIRALVFQSMRESWRPPMEPEVVLELSDDLEMDLVITSSKEKKRRANVEKLKISLSILYNGQEVCSYDISGFDLQFKSTLNLILPLKTSQLPRNLTVQIRQGRHFILPSKILADVSIPFPARNVTRDLATTTDIELAGKATGSCSHGPCCLPHPTAVINYLISWGKDTEGQILQPNDKYWSMNRSSSPLKHPRTSEQLKTWIEKSKLDPNDPRNLHIINQLKDGNNEELDMIEFSSEIPNNARLRVLELRARGEPEFCNLKMIPSSERELPPDILKEFESRKEKPESEISEDMQPLRESSINAHRIWGRRALRRIRARVQLQRRLASRRKQLRDIVSEDLVPDIGTLGLTMIQWLQPARPLRPIRKARQQLASLPGLEKEATLIVNIVSAFQVPVRRDLDVPATSGSVTSSAGFCTIAVRPFIEVTLQNVTQRTAAADGANPTWNQELQLPIGTGCDITEHVYIHLFDEITIDILEDERLRGVDIHTRHERAWLGSISFPLSALQHSSRIDGTFPLSSPPLLGYERESPLRQFTNSTNLDSSPMSSVDDTASSDDTRTFVTVFLTVQPALQTPTSLQERLETCESNDVEQQLETWQAEYQVRFPSRRVFGLVPDQTGKSVCVTKFIRPIAPPVMHEGEVTSVRIAADRAAKLVSLITCSDPGTAPQVWLPADQSINLGICDPLPRAALLTCLLQGLGLRAWLLIGWGPTVGASGFVLTKGLANGTDEAWVWEPSTGQRTRLDDPFCPVHLVWALVNQENVWGNVQREDGARRCKIDTARVSDWLPAFPPGGLVATPDFSLQPSAVPWSPTLHNICTELAENLEGILKDAFLTWRPSLRTRWNRHCTSVLRRVLHAFENVTLAQQNLVRSSAEITRELQPLLGAHKMIGYPLQMGYTDDATIVQAVNQTQLHENRNPDVEFAIAVHVAPLFNNLISVFVYASSLVRRR